MAEEQFPPHVLAETAVAGPAAIAAFLRAHPPPLNPGVSVGEFLAALAATQEDASLEFSWVWDYLFDDSAMLLEAFDGAAQLPPVTRAAWLRNIFDCHSEFLLESGDLHRYWDYPKYLEVALANGLGTELAAAINSDPPVHWWTLTAEAISWIVDQFQTAHATGDHPRMAALRATFNWADLEELEECVEEGQAELSPADLAAVRQILQPPKGAGCA